MALYAFDGTWNTAKDNEDPTYQNTNVFRFYQAYHKRSQTDDLYLAGVGTRWDVLGKVLGGVFGLGELPRINDAYRPPVQGLDGGRHRHRRGWLQPWCRHDLGFLPLHSGARHQAAGQRSGRRAESSHSLSWSVGRGCRIRPGQPRQYRAEHRAPLVAAQIEPAVLLPRHGARRASPVLPAHTASGRAGSVVPWCALGRRRRQYQQGAERHRPEVDAEQGEGRLAPHC